MKTNVLKTVSLFLWMILGSTVFGAAAGGETDDASAGGGHSGRPASSHVAEEEIPDATTFMIGSCLFSESFWKILLGNEGCPQDLLKAKRLLNANPALANSRISCKNPIFNGQPILWAAAWLNNDEALALLLNTVGIDPDLKNPWDYNGLNYRALACAAFHGNSSMTSRLLDAGAQVNVVDETNQAPLILLITHPQPSLAHYNTLRLLLDRGAIPTTPFLVKGVSHTPFSFAIGNGRIEVAKILASGGWGRRKPAVFRWVAERI